MKPRILLLLFFGIKLSECDREPNYDKVTVANDLEERARIIMIDRNMWFHAGNDSNITFSTSSGGRIFFDNIDASILTYYVSFRNHSETLANLQHGYYTLLFSARENYELLSELDENKKRIINQYANNSEEFKKIHNFQINQTQISDKIEAHLLYWRKEVEDLEKKLKNSACDKFQCANGGICIPKLGDDFVCLCPSHYSGDKCEDDVNECLEFNPCFNKGTCVNIRDGFRCECEEGYHGPFCQYHQDSCSETSQLCGPHGACVSTIGTSYDCHCHVGFKKSDDTKNPTCIDIDECLTNPCHPGIECINLDGSYQCFGCPPGYKMDHTGCVDVNECDSIGACAIDVDCRNLLGSYECGPCPTGSSGDSKQRCTIETPCTPSPCSDHLICLENDHLDSPGGFTCLCESNFVLDEETNTCVNNLHEKCINNVCLNGGYCEPTTLTDYKCHCDRGYVGKHCEHASPCFLNPCKNGVCKILNEKNRICLCDPHYYGELCEFHENMFDVHLTNLTGTYKLTPSTNNKRIVQNTYFHISQPYSLLKITFTYYKSEGTEKLILYDGRDENAHIFKTFSGNRANAPVLYQNITMTTTYALLKFIGTNGEYEINYQVVPRGCGYTTSKPKGHLVIPENTQDIVCEWFISAPMDKLIKIIIPSLVMHSGKQISCEQNKLEIYDGFTFHGQTTIEKICSNVQVPYPLISTGPFLTVSFISDMAPSSENLTKVSGFSLTYEIIEREGFWCGFTADNKDQQTGFHGYIESPNYGSLYPPNIKCYWRIFGAGQNNNRDDFITKLSFESFDLPASNNRMKRRGHVMRFWMCNRADYISLISSNVNDRYCNALRPSGNVINARGNVDITFSSDDSVQGKGFRLRYEVVCERKLEGNGSIQTWNFPNGGSVGTCVYTIQAKTDHTIKLTFKSILLDVFSVEQCESMYNSTNATNYVEITGDFELGSVRYTCEYDNFVENGTITAGSRKPLVITVVSDGNPNFKGISFEYYTYKIECGGLVTGEWFESPGYPINYPLNSKCIYRIESKDVIVITFLSFELSAHADNGITCSHDRIEIHAPNDKSVNGAKFCGSVPPHPITVTGGLVEIIFYSENTTSTGIKARVEKIAVANRTTCHHTLTSPDGQITFNSDDFSPCKSFYWHIRVQPSQQIHFTINQMKTSCKTSMFQINEDHMARFPLPCHHENIQNYHTISNRATVSFVRTTSEPASFSITYETSYGCSDAKNVFSGYIYAPQFPHSEQRNVDCQWNLIASSGNQMKFRILVIDELAGEDQNCSDSGNYLKVYEGERTKNNELGVYCHSSAGSSVLTSQKNTLSVIYSQNMNIPTSLYGFVGQFITVCKDIILTKPYGIIQSPGYPNRVPYNVECSWTIRLPIGNRVVIKFSNFDVQIGEDGQDCSLNKFSIEDGDMKSSVVSNSSGVFESTDHWFCESKTPVELHSRHNIAHLYYKSTVQTNKFMLHYHTLGCVSEIRTSQKIQITRDSIDLDAEFFECQYTIIAPVDKRINLVINLFNIAHNDDCKYSSDGTFRGMAIFMGASNSSGHPQQTICSKNSKFEYKSHSSELFVIIVLNGRSINPDKNIFLDASVTFIDPESGDRCGANIDLGHKHQHTLMSPHYPSIDPNGDACRWYIKSDLGYHINFELNKYHIPNEKSVTKDELYDDDDGDRRNEKLWRTGVVVIRNDDPLALAQEPGEMFTSSSSSHFIWNPESAFDPINYTDSTAYVYFQGAYIDMADIDRQQNETGFVMTVKQVCGGTVYVEPEEKKLYLEFEPGENCTVVIKSRGESEGIYAIIESFSHADGASAADMFHVYTDGSLSTTYFAKAITLPKYNAKKEIRFEYITKSSIKQKAVIKYSSTVDHCAVLPLLKYSHIYIKTNEELDCSWTIDNTLGNQVEVTLKIGDLVSSPHCAESYVEVRLYNATGKLLKHTCSPSRLSMLKAPSVYLHLKLKRRLDEPPKMKFMAAFMKLYGGSTQSRTLKSPKTDKKETFEWRIDSLEWPHILLRTSCVTLSSTSYIRFKQTSDDRKTDDAYDKTILGLPADETFILPYKKATIEVNMEPSDDFTIEWEPIDENDYNKTTQATKYDCGGELTPTWEWQEITSPLPPGQTSGYENNIHCVWSMKREHLAGFELKFERMDLEYDPTCLKDFVSFTENEVVGRKSRMYNFRTCSSELVGDVLRKGNQDALYIHFITDASGSGSGFKLLYRLSCNVVYHLSSSRNQEYVLTNPKYATDEPVDCLWEIVSTKHRRFTVEVQSLEIGESDECFESNSLKIIEGRNDNITMCGKFENLQIKKIRSSTPNLLISYKSDGSSQNQGFKLSIQEVMVECPGGTIFLDEGSSTRDLYSPKYPGPIPHSSECDYVVSVPEGHRVELSFNPDEFDMQEGSVDDTTMDYLEVRDGSSEHSTLIGRYRGMTPPSSLYSTGNFMFMRLHTDTFVSSQKFVAHFQIASCGGTLILDQENKEYKISSPNEHPIECKWTIRTANTHMILVKVDSYWDELNKEVCKNSDLRIIDGDEKSSDVLLETSKCNDTDYRHFSFKRSSLSEVTVIYKGIFDEKFCSAVCGFQIIVKMSEEKCGGIINNNEGIITLPGYPGKLLPYVKCMWKFKTDPGNVYQLKFKFTDKTNYNYRDGTCYEDIEFHNSPSEPSMDFFTFQKREIFCKNSLEITSIMDTGILIYDDTYTRSLERHNDVINEAWYSPFEISYRTIPAEFVNTSCTTLINQNQTFSFNSSANALHFSDICHFSIVKPPLYGSVNIKVHNLTHSRNSDRLCYVGELDLNFKSDQPIDIDFRQCVFNNSQIFINPSISLFINDLANLEEHKEAKIEVNFQECGGLIKEPITDTITSPNFENHRYLPNSKCRWLLEAPVGQVIQMRIIDMDIQFDYNCKNDRLVIGEGQQHEMNALHTFCHTTSKKNNDFKGADLLDDHFKQITSKSRFMSIVWITDSTREAAGWKLEYEFVNEGNACGNSQRGMSGVIHTTNYSINNYLPNQNCVWDIEVPPGYHIQLHYTFFKIEKSDNCVKDGLYISQLTNYAGINRVGDSFSSKNTLGEAPICGYELPPDYKTQTGKIHINFKSDDQTNEKGFHLTWKAVCGMTYNSTHGIITSPNYPQKYEDYDTTCEYIINANINEHISLKIEDFDLKQWGTDSNCKYGDYIEMELLSFGHPSKYCKARAPYDGMLLLGPVAIRFHKYRSFEESRGFRFQYTINRCGDQIHLDENSELSTLIHHERFDTFLMLDCIWNISTTEGRELVVKFEYFNMPYKTCDIEYIELFDSPNKNSSLGRYCGGHETVPTHLIQSTGPNLLVHAYFASLINPTYNDLKVFKIIVSSTLGAKSGCGGQLEATYQGQHLEPLKNKYGYGYPKHISCGWLIRAPKFHQIKIKFYHLSIDCGSDEISIYDGKEGLSARLFNKACDYTKLSEKTSSGNEVFVRFNSKDGGDRMGFVLHYSLHNESCGDWHYAVDQRHKSRMHLAQAQNCRHYFQGNSVDPIIIRFLTMNISKVDCRQDYIELRDIGAPAECQHPACVKGENQKKVVKYCGGDKIPPHISTTNTMMMTIRVSRNSYVSFDFQLLNNCNRTIDTSEMPSGHLTSRKSSNTICITSLENPLYETQTKKLLLVFMYGSYNITESHINKTVENPSTYFSEEGNVVKIIGTEENHYVASYYTVEKEETNYTEFSTIHTSDGVLTNFEWPNNLTKSMTQVFTIQPPKSQTCQFTSITSNFGYKTISENCENFNSTDYSLVQQFSNNENISEIRFDGCRNKNNADFETLPGVGVRIIFVTDDNSDNDGFGFNMGWNCRNQEDQDD